MRTPILFAALSIVGCNAVLGLDFEPKSNAAEDEGGAHVDAGNDGADANLVDAEGPTIDSEQARLAALRSRIGDAPSLDSYFTSKSWLYWKATSWQARRIPESDTREIPFSLVAANDDVLVTNGLALDPVTLRDPSGAKLAEFDSGPSSVALDDGIVFLAPTATTVDALLWRAANPATQTKIGALTTGGAIAIGKSAEAVYVRDVVVPERLWIVDVAAPSVTSVTTTALFQHATKTDDGIVIGSVAGGEINYRLLTPSTEVDLVPGIESADCVVPPSERIQRSPPIGFGPWLVFASKGGILAYRHSDARLVPIQIRKPEDSFAFYGLQIVRATAQLVFTLSQPQGLYGIALDSVLP